MAWKAFLMQVNENPVPNDTVIITVEFRESVSGKKFQRDFQLTAGNISTIQDAKDVIIPEIAKLDKFDSVVSIIKNAVGSEIK